uniref:Ovule protein n=1 Tax=Heterorhabditis bacteriophora TaxID=37862 RepID=A0A1I7WZG3_HETBA
MIFLSNIYGFHNYLNTKLMQEEENRENVRIVACLSCLSASNSAHVTAWWETVRAIAVIKGLCTPNPKRSI